MTDILRREQARGRREDIVARRVLPGDWTAPPADRPGVETDDTLLVLRTCCHPALSPASQIALTLRAVGGLTTAEVARAFLVPETTMTRRITRAKQTINDSGRSFGPATGWEGDDRQAPVLHVLYLMFTEGYAATTGPNLHRVDLSSEAIRLARIVHRLRPDDSEVAGLLALMLLTDARREARSLPDGTLVPMAEQDRDRWDRGQIEEGVALITEALPLGATGPYQLQAAIAALHDEATTAAATDWPQIVALYELLLEVSENPVVRLNHAVAVGMAGGPEAGLALLEPLDADNRLNDDHRIHAVRAHLLEMTGDAGGAAAAYEAAAARAGSAPHQRYLRARASRLTHDPEHHVRSPHGASTSLPEAPPPGPPDRGASP